ncbi:MAG TPA: alpha/beta fold hydrolase [Pyrinomonadaceae bacterium]|jgi:surfactin synthase thioesterase subunit|nr:alpha/beta fold hydrolase [Pyrinomonadaceae bacterium]
MKSIFLLPYGGGSAASYRSYVARFPPDIARVVPVEIPGRGKRSHEEYAKSIQECAALALQEIDTESEGYILHGHCMGALLAFEAIKLIETSGRQLPIFMVASGRNAPRHVNDWLRRLPELDDRSLFKELQELGGIPRGLSFAMAQHFLTVIRNDQAMIRDYDPGETRIGVPILALAGREDKMTTAAAVADWEDYTSKFLSIEWLDGQHYSFLSQPDRVAVQLEEFCKLVDSSALVGSH